MLKFMRKRSKSFLVYMIFGAIIVVFVFWGAGNFQAEQNNVVATIDNEEITLKDFFSAYQNQVDFYRNLYKDNFSEDLIENLKLKEQTLQGMITSVLILKEARKLKIDVSKEELLDRIKSYPSFQVNGVFNKDLYKRVLSRNRVTANRFENNIKNDLIAEKVERLITLPVEVSDIEAKEFFNYNERMINLQYITLSANTFKDSFQIGEEETQDFFNNNRERFKVPTRIQVGFLRLRPADFNSSVNVSEEEIEEYYNKNIDTFKEEKRVKVRHILVSVSPTDDLEEKRIKTEEIRGKAVDGEDFSSLAREFSEDTSTAQKGGDLGYFGKGEMVRSFEDAAFSLKAGEISEVVRSPFGFHIIKLEDIKEPTTKTLEEVKLQIGVIIASKKAKEMAFKKAQEIADLSIKNGASLKETAAKEGLEVVETPLFSKEERNNQIAATPDLSKSAFSMRTGDISNALEAPAGIFVFELLERVEEHLPTFDEVSALVKSTLISMKTIEKAGSASEEMLTRLKNGEDILTLAKDKGLKAFETGLFSMKKRFVPGINIPLRDGSPLFSLNQKDPYTILNNQDKLYIVKLTEAKAPPEEEYVKAKAEIKRGLLDLKRREAFNKWIESLMDNAEIMINEEMI